MNSPGQHIDRPRRGNVSQAVNLDPVWHAAVDAERRATDCQLDDIWQDYVRGRLRAIWESIGPERILLIGLVRGDEKGVDPIDAKIAARIFAGDQQKCVAGDLGLAPSTVSGRYLRALHGLDLKRNNVPLPLILAAQAWLGVVGVPAAKSAFFKAAGRVCMLVSVPRPFTSSMIGLTPAERDVAQWIIEGCSRFYIAHRRRTSVHTVARQFNAINDALRTTGRYALIRSAVELGCFR